ncbi:MAG TPA: citrate lyase holo-[acyl-carrier protein] synthase [Bacteroidales bacterium]|nr:citrate lyase holo-[acyl-carrier protein] synthase [Bacteroidales bacterium]
MQRDILKAGVKPALEEVLKTRENRARFQETLAEKYPGKTVIAFKLNIPGPVKNNKVIEDIFSIGMEDLMEELSAYKVSILYKKTVDLSTGPEAFYVADLHLYNVKKLMIHLEDEKVLGRLYDFDVFSSENDKVVTRSRGEIGYEDRKCLVCSKPARVCGRNRTHSIDEMHERIIELLQNEPRLK